MFPGRLKQRTDDQQQAEEDHRHAGKRADERAGQQHAGDDQQQPDQQREQLARGEENDADQAPQHTERPCQDAEHAGVLLQTVFQQYTTVYASGAVFHTNFIQSQSKLNPRLHLPAKSGTMVRAP